MSPPVIVKGSNYVVAYLIDDGFLIVWTIHDDAALVFVLPAQNKISVTLEQGAFHRILLSQLIFIPFTEPVIFMVFLEHGSAGYVPSRKDRDSASSFK